MIEAFYSSVMGGSKSSRGGGSSDEETGNTKKKKKKGKKVEQEIEEEDEGEEGEEDDKEQGSFSLILVNLNHNVGSSLTLSFQFNHYFQQDTSAAFWSPVTLCKHFF